MRDQERLNDLAKAEIAALEADGIRLTAAEIVELNAIGWAIESPELRADLARGVPVPLAGAWLWPLTLYAENWFKRVGLKMSGALGDFALAYAMAHGYEDGKLEVAGAEARRAVSEWVGKLRCTIPQLQEAVAQVLRQDAQHPVPHGVDERPMTDGEFSIYLATLSGESPEFWERRCAVGYARAMLVCLFMQNQAEGKPSRHDPKIMAERAMGYRIEQIRESRKQKVAP